MNNGAMRGPQRLSIGIKVFTVAVVILVLMCATTLLTVLMAKRVNEQMRLLTDDYQKAYASLAVTNIRSLNRALTIRRLYINARDGDPDVDMNELKKLAGEDDAAGAKELSRTREMVKIDLQSGGGADPIILSRIDTLLEVAEEQRAKLSTTQTKLVDSLAASTDPRTSRYLLRASDRDREEYEQRLNSTRTELYRAVKAAALNTQQLGRRVVLAIVGITALAGVLGLVFAGIFARSMSRPVHRLLAGTRAVQDGQLDTEVPVTSGDEIGQLTGAFNTMVAELKVKAQIKDTFGKYIDPRIVTGLIERPDLAAAHGERRMMTVSFCDMKGFTSLSESLTPTRLLNVINHYLTLMSEPVRLHDGIIDKYIGDGIMSYWGPPFAPPQEQARLACLAALDQAAQLEALNAALPELIGLKQGLPTVNIRVGIATGDMLVGNIGSDVTKSYTVIGDPVNLASRLETANKQYGTRLICGEATAKLAGEAIEFREIDSIVVVGRTEPERVFELLGRRGEVDPVTRGLRERFAEGLIAYRAGLWEEAHAAFTECRELRPDDGPSLVFLRRVETLRMQAPDDDWNGVWALTEK